ncbi:hypothetical protein SCG7109_AI_00190 [Chlamydiales bacterium SCGC AG-110-M15]|nr:hypothetical protein SCG7109_AI_00190 [Chlamydiales bacterium SCGC AG-110-M15]
MEISSVKDKTKLSSHDPDISFKDNKKVGSALLECLLENDTEGFIEILDTYLKVNRSRVAKKAKLARSTVQQALSKTGNPTLKTLAKIVHQSMLL